jgi:23S rRNA (cytidine2498-2'-O)-methyltransferase
MKAYLAAEGFERELAEELGWRGLKFREHGRLFISDDDSSAEMAWAQNTWLHLSEISFESIGDAARKLRELGPLWSLHSVTHHRRASLIQEKLPKLRSRELEFLAELPKAPLGSWTLLSENLLLASPNCSSPLPNGEVHFKEDKISPPSRAYLKLWELFTVYGVRPQPGERCIDLGAAPGGWTWVLAKLGCRVTAVDRSELAPEVVGMPGVTFVKGNAFTAKPEDFDTKIDWMFSDVICFPEQIEELIGKWMASGSCRNLVCTIKFKGNTNHEVSRRLQTLPGARMKHLFSNKHEMTWWLTT